MRNVQQTGHCTAQQKQPPTNQHACVVQQQKKGWIVPAPTDHHPSQIFASLGKSPRKTATQIWSLKARATQETTQSSSQFVAVHGI